MQRKHGWYYSDNSERVLNRKGSGEAPVIADEDGNYSDRIFQAKDHKYEGEASLWSLLGPLQYDGMVIRQHAEVYHTERGEWLQASTIDVVGDWDDDEIEPEVTFTVQHSLPTQQIVYYGNELEQLRSSNILRTKQEVNQDINQLMEEMRMEV